MNDYDQPVDNRATYLTYDNELVQITDAQWSEVLDAEFALGRALTLEEIERVQVAII